MMHDEKNTPYPSDCSLTEALRERAMQRNQPIPRSEAWRAALPRAGNVRLLLLDVDGVLTNGKITYSDSGEEIKSFHARDGLGIRLLHEAGIQVGLITARSSRALERRVQDLCLSHVVQGQRNKLLAYEEILKTTGLRPPQTACMGDDWLDLPLLGRAGLALAPADAAPEVCRRAHYCTERRGGEGAVREACDLILAGHGLLKQMLARYDF